MIRVLLADDQGLVRAGFRMILRAERDIEVVGEASDGEEAVTRARETTPESAQLLVKRARDYLDEATQGLQPMDEPMLPLAATQQIQRLPVVRMSIAGAKDGLVVGFILMLIVPKLRRRRAYA